MNTEIMVPEPRPMEVLIENDEDALDCGVAAGTENWVCRRWLGDRVVVEFSDETETTYKFTAPEFVCTFLEYMDK